MSELTLSRQSPLVILADTYVSAAWLARELHLSTTEFHVATDPDHMQGLHGFPYTVVCDISVCRPTAEKVHEMVSLAEQRQGYEVSEAQIITRTAPTPRKL